MNMAVEKDKLLKLNYILKRLQAEGLKDPLARFLIIQNFVQYHLSTLVFFRARRKDKDLYEKLEKSTLGQLLNYFKVCVNQRREIGLIEDLISFVKKRNYLVHRLLHDPEGARFLRTAEETCSLGRKIMVRLENAIESERQSSALLKILREGIE